MARIKRTEQYRKLTGRWCLRMPQGPGVLGGDYCGTTAALEVCERKSFRWLMDNALAVHEGQGDHELSEDRAYWASLPKTALVMVCADGYGRTISESLRRKGRLDRYDKADRREARHARHSLRGR